MSELTFFTFSKSKTMSVGLRRKKYFENGDPMSRLGCLFSFDNDHDSMRLLPAATTNISLFNTIPTLTFDGMGGGMQVQSYSKSCKEHTIVVKWFGFRFYVIENLGRKVKKEEKEKMTEKSNQILSGRE